MKKVIKNLSIRGFTLIELLVVIAIIALLASIILASLNTARSKGRDANRVQSLQEMAKSIALADTDPAPSFNDGTTNKCGTFTGNRANANTCSVAGVPANLSAYTDPSGGSTLCSTSAANNSTNGTTGTCVYTISTQPAAVISGTNKLSTQNYEICSVLENGNTQYGGAQTSNGSVHVGNDTSTGVTAGCL